MVVRLTDVGWTSESGSARAVSDADGEALTASGSAAGFSCGAGVSARGSGVAPDASGTGLCPSAVSPLAVSARSAGTADRGTGSGSTSVADTNRERVAAGTLHEAAERWSDVPWPAADGPGQSRW